MSTFYRLLVLFIVIFSFLGCAQQPSVQEEAQAQVFSYLDHPHPWNAIQRNQCAYSIFSRRF